MKKIPKKFNKNGYEYTLLKRVGNIVLYEQYQMSHNYLGIVTKNPSSCSDIIRQYEVHKVRLMEPRTRKFKQSDGTINSVTTPAMEKLAMNEDFGSYGWHFQHKVNADKFFDEKVEQEKIQ